MTRYLNELCEGYRLFGEDWKPIADACAALVQYRKWIEVDRHRLMLLTLRISKLPNGETKEDYKSIFLDMTKRLQEFTREEHELDTFIVQSFKEVLLKPIKTDGVPRVQSNKDRKRKGK
jgi:hypothetical protein